jgi:LacI family transcriptional regulator
MNIYDISRLAGVSRKTVQRVLNNATNVKPETHAKIHQIMQEHHYEPSAVARKLSSRKPNTLAIFIIQDEKQYKLYTDDLFYGAVIGGIISHCNSRNYNTLVSILDISDTDQLLSLYKQKSIDAGIIISWSNVQSIVDKVIKAGFKIAVFDQNNIAPNTQGIPIPLLDNWQSAYNAAEYLLHLGHSRLAIITGDMNIPCSPERLDGFLRAIQDHGLPAQDSSIFYGHFIEKSGSDAITYWMENDQLPDAIFCSNDLMAYGALQTLTRYGISIPDQISLIGFDDLLISAYMHPPLTTMRTPRVEMAQAITEQLINHLESTEQAVITNPHFVASLVERASCRPIK